MPAMIFNKDDLPEPFKTNNADFGAIKKREVNVLVLFFAGINLLTPAIENTILSPPIQPTRRESNMDKIGD